MTLLKGRLDREAGAKLRAALEPLAAPKPADKGDQDPRTTAQRNADALDAVLDIALATDDLPRAGGQRPHVIVTIPLDSLRENLPDTTPAAPGVLENSGQPLTAGQVRRLACDAHVLPVVLGEDSQPLDVGRAHRTAPPALRTALLTRDGPCAFPHCPHPPGTPEAHHVTPWADGGATAVTNMVMLCSRHHRIVHAQGWDIDLTSGTPMFLPPATMDPWRRPRPGNTPHHQLDLTTLTTSEGNNPHTTIQLHELLHNTQQPHTTTTTEPKSHSGREESPRTKEPSRQGPTPQRPPPE